MPLPPQRFPFGHDNLKNISVRPFKFGMWVYMGNTTTLLFCDLDLQFQGRLALKEFQDLCLNLIATIATDNTMVDAYLRSGLVSRALFLPYFGES